MNRRRALCPIVLLAALAAGSAQAQPAPPAATLTLLSRPAGASFRVTAGQEVVGRTPATLELGIQGKVDVVGWDTGYRHWHRRLVLEGAGADTVWISLERKSRLLAGARSLVLPAWGQFYDDRPVHGWTMVVLAVAAAGAAGWAHVNHQHKLDDRDAAASLFHTPGGDKTRQRLELDAAQAELEDALQLRRQVDGAAMGVWGLGVLDAVVSGPGWPRREPAQAASGLPAPGAAVTLAARVRF